MGDQERMKGFTLIGWKLYYDKGKTITSEEMKFVDAPQDGVQFFVRFYLTNIGTISREIMTGQDMYTLTREEVESYELPPEIKKGSFLRDEDYDSLTIVVRNDKEVITRMI